MSRATHEAERWPELAALLEQLCDARGTVCERSVAAVSAYDAMRFHEDVTESLALECLALSHERRRELLVDNQVQSDDGMLSLLAMLTTVQGRGTKSMPALVSQIRQALHTCDRLRPLVHAADDFFAFHVVRLHPNLGALHQEYVQRRLSLKEAEATERDLALKLLDQLSAQGQA